jgi:tungstate transport system ATP-binding protein
MRQESPKSPVILSLQGVSCAIQGFWVLKDLNIELHAQERLALVGTNGSGKTSLLKLLHGLIKPQSGHLHWQTHSPVRQAMLFQRPQMINSSVRHHVALALWAQGLKWPVALKKVQGVLREAGLADCAQQSAKTLSIGQQQRLSLARAWACEPQLLLLDEPTASLDPSFKSQVETMIEHWAQIRTGVEEADHTLVLASHNLGQVKRLASRVIFLEEGEIHADLPVWEFFNSPLAITHPKAHAFLRGEVI